MKADIKTNRCLALYHWEIWHPDIFKARFGRAALFLPDRTRMEFILLSLIQAKRGDAKPGKQMPATWRRTLRSSTTSGSSCRSSTQRSMAWVRSTTCPLWPEPVHARRRTSWPPGTACSLLPSYILCTKWEHWKCSVLIYEAWVGIFRGFQLL